jgi:BirA family biotin operon repressor/biotin-[acetyl-CoA-carboxylase] ligase
MLSESVLQQGLETRLFGKKIYTFETIDSTNDCCRALAGCWAHEGTVVIAEKQTAGRGRLGRVWLANPNQNLTFSLILRPSIPPEKLPLLSLYAAVAIADAVKKAIGADVECKWPNDLLLNGKKFGGVLLEASVQQDAVEHVIVGIGVNVNQEVFPEALGDRATSLSLGAGKEIDRFEVFRLILSSLEAHYTKMMASGVESILPLWLARSSMVNRTISVSQQGTVYSGVVKGLSRDGGLVVQRDGAEQTLFAGDITILEM